MLHVRLKIKLKSLKHYAKVVQILTEYGYRHVSDDIPNERLYLFDTIRKWSKQGWLYISDDNKFMAFTNNQPIKYVHEYTLKQLRTALENNLNAKAK